MEDDAAIYLAKATESLLTAESEFVSARYNSCANRCYYACLQAAIAALLREGIRVKDDQWGHGFVQARFVGLFINRRKRYGVELRRVLADNQVLRDTADYRPQHVSRIEASRALARSRAFVGAVQQGETVP